VASRATADDRLWLVLADGVPTRVTRAELLRRLDAVTAQSTRLDLGEAVRSAAVVVGESGLQQQEVVVFSDLQATAVSSGEPIAAPVWVARPSAAPENAGIDSLAVEPSVWTLSGEVIAAIGGDRATPVGVRLMLDEMDVARSVGRTGEQVTLQVAPPRTGWLVGAVQLDADELRADDRRWFAVHATAPVAAEIASPLGPFVSEGLAVLIEAGQLRAGPSVTLGERPAAGSSVVFPPAEPAMVGAVNRALAAAGISWRYGELMEGEWTLETGGVGDGLPVFRRYRLTGTGTVIARVAGEPWLVQAGSVTVVASRLEPDWTALPASAAFLPFLRHVITEVALREAGVVSALVGDAVAVPAAAVALEFPTGRVRIPETGILAPVDDPGVYALFDAEGDTVGAVVVNHDARESALTSATPAQLTAAWGPTTSVVSGRELEASLFGGTARAELSTVLLVAALLLAVVELFVSGFGAGRIRP
jgi:hypothetical protein